MSSTYKFGYRDITQHGKAELGRRAVAVGKVLPATTTADLFTVTGSVLVTGLFGVVSTLFTATGVKIQLGIAGDLNAIADVPAVAYANTAVGSVIVMPLTGGGALPAVVTTSTAAAAAALFTLNANLKITTDATNTGAVTWVLEYVSLTKNAGSSVAAA